MSRNLVIRQCMKCKSMVKVLKGEENNLVCCGEQMRKVVPNSFDAAFEKHVPTYEIEKDKIIVKVNHVMEEDHYIEWICMCSDNKECYVYFRPREVAQAVFDYIPGATLYAYCNKHSLWKNEVK